MKTNFIVIAALAALAAAGCSGKVSETTVIKGTFTGEEAPGSVQVTVGEALDTTVMLDAGSFKLEVPTNLAEMGSVSTQTARVNFIPDGTKLTVILNEDGSLGITSSSPTVSATQKMSDFTTEYNDFMKDAMQRMQALDQNDTAAIEALYEEVEAKDYELQSNAFSENTDNAFGLMMLSRMQYDRTPEQLDSMISVLSPELQESETVQDIKAAIAAKAATAEGKMFTDFEVDGVKFSDYIGKGKYMLVDFWASWCGPCKGEIPNLKNVYKKYSGKDFDILAVAVWDQPSASVDTAKAYGIPWKQILNTQRVATDIYAIQGIPHIILFGPDGTILKRNLRGEAIEEEIAKYVKPVK